MVYGLDKLPWGRGRGFRRRPGFESVSRRGEHGRARFQVKGIRFVPVPSFLPFYTSLFFFLLLRLPPAIPLTLDFPSQFSYKARHFLLPNSEIHFPFLAVFNILRTSTILSILSD